MFKKDNSKLKKVFLINFIISILGTNYIRSMEENRVNPFYQPSLDIKTIDSDKTKHPSTNYPFLGQKLDFSTKDGIKNIYDITNNYLENNLELYNIYYNSLKERIKNRLKKTRLFDTMKDRKKAAMNQYNKVAKSTMESMKNELLKYINDEEVVVFDGYSVEDKKNIKRTKKKNDYLNDIFIRIKYILEQGMFAPLRKFEKDAWKALDEHFQKEADQMLTAEESKELSTTTHHTQPKAELMQSSEAPGHDSEKKMWGKVIPSENRDKGVIQLSRGQEAGVVRPNILSEEESVSEVIDGSQEKSSSQTKTLQSDESQLEPNNNMIDASPDIPIGQQQNIEPRGKPKQGIVRRGGKTRELKTND